MNLKVGIVGLPNAGPSRTLAALEVYVLASRWRVYGTAQFVADRKFHFSI
ncbi:MAG: hypothetical protein Q7S76_03910 [bacterium]|nr:hypothetical protein [bacterium]